MKRRCKYHIHKRRHEWTNLKKIETDCNCGLWKLVCLTVFQSSFLLFVTFDIMFAGPPGSPRAGMLFKSKKTIYQSLPTVDHLTDDTFVLHRGNWSPFLWLFPTSWVRATQVRDGKTILLAFWECCWHESGRQMCYFKVSWGRKTDKGRVAAYTGYLVFMFNTADFVKFVSEFATLETRKELEPKCVPQLFVGSLLGTDRSTIGQLFPPVPSNSSRSLCEN